MSDIILVGNGSSILDKDNGKAIDSFGTVVRFNSYKIKGFEKHTGRKTSIWFTVNRSHMSEIEDYQVVYVHSWEYNESKCELTKHIKKYVEPIKVSGDFIRSIPVKSPSTGLIAICLFIKQYGKVTITGFDWWDREKHHYGDNEKRGTLHSPSEEYKLIKSLEQQNKLTFL